MKIAESSRHRPHKAQNEFASFDVVGVQLRAEDKGNKISLCVSMFIFMDAGPTQSRGNLQSE